MRNDMNDDFLHRLRKEPNAQYLAQLKASLDRQALRQAKTRRTLFRTAILAVLIGGSAVAVAFVAWRGVPHPFGTMAEVRDARGERSAPAKNVISSPQGGGGSKTGAAPAIGAELAPTAATSATSAATATTVAGSDAARPAFSVAGAGGFIANVEDFVRTPVRLGLMKKPGLIETTTSQAIAMLCHVRGIAGADSATANVVGASRRISAAELATCKRNGILRVTELRPGYEAAVLVRSKLYGAPRLPARDIFLALAARVPDLPNRPYALISNPYRVWNSIDSSLSQEQIEISGPQWSSPTAVVFRETVMEAGCSSFPGIASLKDRDPAAFDKICHSVRQDGVYRVFSQPDSSLASRLDTYPNAMALLSYKQLADMPAAVAASIDGVDPSAETIAAGTYPGSRPLYLYVNSLQAMASHSLSDFVLGLERSALGGDFSLVVPDSAQRQSEMRNAMTLPELIL
jgi:phosphate transport system substrate-binding protein